MAEAYLGGHSIIYTHPVGYAGEGRKRRGPKAGGIQPEWTGPETKLIKAGEKPPAGVIRITVRGKRRRRF